MKMYSSPQPVELYLDRELECSCGRTHYVDIKDVLIGPGAIKKLPEFVKKHGYSRPYIICDEITYQIAGKHCEGLLNEAGIICVSHIIGHMGFDEATLGELVINMPADCDLWVAVGTGSITDMVRYATFKLCLPCFTLATGAPMDGFAASIGVMNVNNLKATMEAHNTEVIIGDTDILKGAPYRMTVAGFGDLIGKISSINDWELSRIINEEHFCRPIAELVQDCVSEILGKSEQVRDKNPETFGEVMRGLVLSGVAISLYGNSRPASGAEHHMSHFWETLGDLKGKQFAMHGEQVAVGTVLMLMLAKELSEFDVDFNAARAKAKLYDEKMWQENVRCVYGDAAGEILAIEAKAQKNSAENVLKRIGSIERNWDAIIKQLRSLPPASELIDSLHLIGCPALPKEINVDNELLKSTFLYAKETRARYTLLQMAYDLGVLEELADKVIANLGA